MKRYKAHFVDASTGEIYPAGEFDLPDDYYGAADEAVRSVPRRGPDDPFAGLTPVRSPRRGK